MGFPGGAVDENMPANPGVTGSSPGLGRSHMPWSNWAHELQLLSLRVWSLCSATREATIVRGPRTTMKSGPCLPQLEKALAQKRRPNTIINKLKKKIFQQTEVQDQMASQVNSIKHLEKSQHPSFSNSSKKLQRKEYSQTHSTRPPSP